MACRCRLPRGGAPGRGRAHRSFLVATPPSAGLVTSRQTFVLRCRNWRFGLQSSRGVAKAKAMPPLRTTIPPLKRYCHANPARPPVRLARQNKCLAQTNKSDTRAKATDKRRSDTGSAAQFRALAKLAKGKTRYWISAAGLLNDHWYVGSPPSLPGMRRGADPVRGAAPRADGERTMTTRGELIPAQETMPGSPKLEFEFVPHQNKPKAIYLRLDGERIAYRGKPNTPQAAMWVSMKSGYRVEDNAALDGVTVYFDDVRINTPTFKTKGATHE